MALNTQILEIDKFVSIPEVAKAINVSEESLKTLNPAYKRGIVNGSDEIHRRLIIPELAGDINKDQLYLALNTTVETPTEVIALVNDDVRSSNKRSAQSSRHRVRRGETLAAIAKKYDVSVQNLKAWNNVKGSSVKTGTSLIVSSSVNTRLAQKTSSRSSKKSNMLVYTVKKGDTLSEIANNKGVSLSKLKADNNLSHSKLKPGMKLKINRG
jgi:membrane-bound lytic murein transglycosylase D